VLKQNHEPIIEILSKLYDVDNKPAPESKKKSARGGGRVLSHTNNSVGDVESI